jgi:hypothetical protein
MASPLRGGGSERFQEGQEMEKIREVCGRNWAAIFIVITFSASCFGSYGGGDGSAGNPYQIWTAEQMNTIGLNTADWDKCFMLMADIDMSAYTGTQYNIIGNDTTKFTGTFDGNNHTISNLNYITTTAVVYTGLFGYTDNASIKNLNLENVNISTRGRYASGLVGYQKNGSIDNCSVSGSIAASPFYTSYSSNPNCAGVLVGLQSEGTITHCTSAGSVNVYATNAIFYIGGLAGSSSGIISVCTSTSTVAAYTDHGSNDYGTDAGGLVGYQEEGAIINCTCSGSVTISPHFGYYASCAGGLVGLQWTGVINGCSSTGSASASITGSYGDPKAFAGGFAGGQFWGTIANCFSTGSALASSDSCPVYAGGFGGGQDYGIIANCYSTGSATATSGTASIGGLLGGQTSGIVTSCFWDMETSGIDTSEGGAGAVGKTTAEMKTLTTFTAAGWDFVGESVNGLHDYWAIENNDYPRASIHNWTLAGDGSSANPYVITSIADLAKVWLKSYACFRLDVDLDLSGVLWSTPIVQIFTGKFDGGGHVVSGLTYRTEGQGVDIGFFGCANYAQIDNLILENVNIPSQGRYAGCLAGRQRYGTITNCSVSGSINSSFLENRVGGLVGTKEFGTIINCSSTVSIEAYSLNFHTYAGGLVGFSTGTITNCSSYGPVNVTASSAYYAYAGGLVGVSGDTIINCASYGSVNAFAPSNNYAGGLVGSQSSGILVYCYSAGAISATGTNLYQGGLLGYQSSSGKAQACFWDMETSGMTTSAGGSGVTGKTTAEMKTLATFTSAGWDFTDENVIGIHDYWMMLENDYPRLAIHAWTMVGDGTAVTPYRITSIADLAEVWLKPFASYRLDTDLDLSGLSWSTPVIPFFSGIFEGQGHVISGLTYTTGCRGAYIGFFGYDNYAIIRNTILQNVNIHVEGRYVGSLAGAQYYGTIASCGSTGSVTALFSNSSLYVGGLTGSQRYGTITNCYSTCAASASATNASVSVGGLLGNQREYSSIIEKCYATGFVSATGTTLYKGGLLGDQDSGVVKGCFWDKDTSGIATSAGGAGVVGKTTAEMKMLATFTGADWDFIDAEDGKTEDIWRMCADGVDYPHLTWEYVKNGDFACPDGVGIEDLARLAGDWMETYSAGLYGADANGDGLVNLADYAVLAEH